MFNRPRKKHSLGPAVPSFGGQCIPVSGRRTPFGNQRPRCPACGKVVAGRPEDTVRGSHGSGHDGSLIPHFCLVGARSRRSDDSHFIDDWFDVATTCMRAGPARGNRNHLLGEVPPWLHLQAMDCKTQHVVGERGRQRRMASRQKVEAAVTVVSGVILLPFLPKDAL